MVYDPQKAFEIIFPLYKLMLEEAHLLDKIMVFHLRMLYLFANQLFSVRRTLP